MELNPYTNLPEDRGGEPNPYLNPKPGGLPASFYNPVPVYGPAGADNVAFERDLDNFEREARAQSWGELGGNALVQSLTTFGGQMIEGIGALYELGEKAGRGLLGQKDESPWQNWVTDLGKGLQEYGQDNFTIHLTQQAQGGAERFIDGTWWASFVPSLASTAAMFVPSAGVASMATRGLAQFGKVGRATGAIRRVAMSNRAQQGVGVLSATAASSHMENFMQATQSYHTVYNEAVEAGLSEEAAREAAGAGAAHTYQLGWMTAATNLVEYGLALRGVKWVNRNDSQRLDQAIGGLGRQGSFAGKIQQVARRNLGIGAQMKDRTALLIQGLAEGTEEIVQELFVKEGERVGRMTGGLDYEEGDFLERLSQHIKDPAAQDAFLAGMLGSAVMGKGREGIMNRLNKQQRVADMERTIARIEDVRAVLQPIANGLPMGLGKTPDQTRNHLVAGLGVAAAQNGQLDLERDTFQAVLDMTDEEIAEEFAKGVTDPVEQAALVKDVRNNADEGLATLDDIEQGFETYRSAGLGTGDPEKDLFLPMLYGNLVETEYTVRGMKDSLAELEALQAEVEADENGRFSDEQKANLALTIEGAQSKIKEAEENRSRLLNDKEYRDGWLAKKAEINKARLKAIEEVGRLKKEAEKKKKLAEKKAETPPKKEAAETEPTATTPADDPDDMIDPADIAGFLDDEDAIPDAEETAEPAAEQNVMDGLGFGIDRREDSDVTAEIVGGDTEPIPSLPEPDVDPDEETGSFVRPDDQTLAALSGQDPVDADPIDDLFGPDEEAAPDAPSESLEDVVQSVFGSSFTNLGSKVLQNIVYDATVLLDVATRVGKPITKASFQEYGTSVIARLFLGGPTHDTLYAHLLADPEGTLLAIQDFAQDALDELSDSTDAEVSHTDQLADAEPGDPPPGEISADDMAAQREEDRKRHRDMEDAVPEGRALFKYFFFEDQNNLTPGEGQGDAETFFGDPSVDLPGMIEAGRLVVQASRFPASVMPYEDAANPDEYWIRLTLFEKKADGTLVEVQWRGKPVNGFFPEDQALDLRNYIVSRLEAGQTVDLVPTRVLPGFLSNTHWDFASGWGEVRNNVAETFAALGHPNPAIGVQLETGLIVNSSGQPIVPGVRSPMTKGVVFAVVKSPTGAPVPVALHTRHVTDTEARTLVDAYLQLLDGDGPASPFNDPSGQTEGLSIEALLNHITYEGPITSKKYALKDRSRVLYFKRGRGLQVGNQLYKSREEIEAAREEIVAHIIKHKLANVRVGALRSTVGSLFGGDVRLFGQSLRSTMPYTDLLFGGDNPVLATDLPTTRPNGEPLGQMFDRTMLEFTLAETTEESLSAEGSDVVSDDAPGLDEERASRADELLSKYAHLEEDVPPIGDEDFGPDNPPFRRVTGEVETPIDVESEVAWIERHLGVDVTVEVLEDVIRFAGGEAWGSFKDGLIRLSRGGEAGTGFHEAYHAIHRMYLTDGEQAAILNEARRIWGSLPPAELEERLADAFMEYVQSEGRLLPGQPDGTIARFFDRILRWIQRVTGNGSEMERIFREVRSGRFRDRAPVGGPRLQTAYRLSTTFTQDQLRSITESVLYRAFKTSEILDENLLDNLGGLRVYKAQQYYAEQLSTLLAQVKAVRDGTLTMTPEAFDALDAHVDRVGKVVTHWESDVLPAVQDALLRYGISGVESKTQESIDEAAAKNGGDLAQHTKAPYTRSNKDSATAAVRLLIALTPRVEKVQADGSYVYDESGYLGEPRMASYGVLWNKVEGALQGVVDHWQDGPNGPVLVHAFDQMMAKLDAEAAVDPNVAALVARIRQLPEHLQTQFYNTFAKVDYNFQTVELDRGRWKDREGKVHHSFKVKVGGADVSAPYKRRMVEWAQAANVPGDLDLQASLLAVIEAARREPSAVRAASHLQAWFASFGIEVSPAALLRAAQESNVLQRPSDAVSMLAAELTYIAKRSKEGEPIQAVLEDERSILTRIATAQIAIEGTAADNIVLGPDGKPYWTRSMYTSLFQTVLRLKKNDPVLLQTLRHGPLGKASTWLDRLQTEEGREAFGFGSLLKLLDRSVEGSSDLYNGASVTDLRPPELFVLQFAAMMQGVTNPGQGLHFTLNMADKGNATVIQGMPVSSLVSKEGAVDTVRIEGNEAVSLGPQVLRQFSNYALAEITRVAIAQREVEAGGRLIDNYHTKAANGLRLHLFPELNPEPLSESNPELYEAIYEDTDDGPRVRSVLGDEGPLLREIGKYIQPSILAVLNDGIQEAQDLGLVEAKADGLLVQKKRFMSDPLAVAYRDRIPVSDRDVHRTYPKAPRTRSTYDALRLKIAQRQIVPTALAEFALNQLVSHVEQAVLFHGDWAMYKSLDDFRKRTPAAVAHGQKLRTDLVPPTFNVAFLEDVELNPNANNAYAKGLRAFFIDHYVSQGDTKKAATEKANARVAPYRQVNKTDAQGYITLSRARDILRGLGKWTPAMEDAYYGRTGDFATIQEAWDTAFQNGGLEPLKGVHFEQIVDGPSTRPVYLKYSQAILFPGLAPELDKLADWMTEHDVQEAVYGSGVKVGSGGKQQVWDNGVFVGTDTPHVATLSNDAWRLQVELPYHGLRSGLIASQQQKNILGNVELDGTYLLDGKEVSGADFVMEFHRVYGALSRNGLDGLVRELQIGRDGTIGDPAALRDLIVEELRSRNAPDTLIESLPFDAEGNLTASLSSHPAASRLQAVLFSLLRNRSVRLKGPGGSLIQVSSTGFYKPERYSDLDEEVKAGITLLAPRWDGGFKPGHVLLPSYFRDLVPNADSLTKEQWAEYFEANPDLLKVVGYRIPNQAKASIDALEVVGFLPPAAGDSIVLYDEVTAKTGSDFDIDKMYVMVPAVRRATTKADKPEDVPATSPAGDRLAWRDTLEMVSEFFEEQGEPSAIESHRVEEGVHYVSRDAEGKINGSLYFNLVGEDEKLSELGVLVRPDQRRMGVASRMYKAAESDGYDVEAGSDSSFQSAQGKAFQTARRARAAQTAPIEVVPFLTDENSTLDERYDAYQRRHVKLGGVVRSVLSDEAEKTMRRSWAQFKRIRNSIFQDAGDVAWKMERVLFDTRDAKTGRITRHGLIDALGDRGLSEQVRQFAKTLNEAKLKPVERLKAYVNEISDLREGLGEDHPLYLGLGDVQATLVEGIETSEGRKEDAQSLLQRSNERMKEIRERRYDDAPPHVQAAVDAATGAIIEKALADGRIMPKETFATLPIERQNAPEAVHNRAISLYHQLYADPRTFAESMTPLDATSTRPEAHRLKALALGAPDEVLSDPDATEAWLNEQGSLSGVQEFSGRNQRLLKKVFAGGKTGVGLTANHLSDHNLAQLADLGLWAGFGVGHVEEVPDGVDKDGNAKTRLRTSLARVRDVDGRTISDTLSAILNSFVDIAKDPYVFDLNLNPLTANVAFTLVRSGAGETRTFGFLGQPILKRFVEISDWYESPLSKTVFEDGRPLDPGALTLQALEDLRAELLQNEDVEPRAFTDEEVFDPSLQREMIRLGGEIERGEIPSDPQVTADYLAYQKAVWTLYERLNETSKILTAQTLGSKFDTEGAGSSVAAALVLKSRYDWASNSPLLDNFDRKFAGTMHQAYREGSFDLVFPWGKQSVFDGVMHEVSPGVLTLFKTVMGLVDKRASNEELNSAVLREITSLVIAGSPLHASPDELQAMTRGETSMAKRLREVKEGPLGENLLVRHLRYGTTDDGIDRVYAAYSASEEEVDALSSAWEEILYHEDKAVRTFAQDLVRLAVSQSGMQKGLYTFFDLIPPSYLRSSGYFEYVAERERAFQDPNVFGPPTAFSVLLHLAEDARLVPQNVRLSKVTDKIEHGRVDGKKAVVAFRIERDSREGARFRRLSTTFEDTGIHWQPLIRTTEGLFLWAGTDSEGGAVYHRVRDLPTRHKGHRLSFHTEDGGLPTTLQTVGEPTMLPVYPPFVPREEDHVADDSEEAGRLGSTYLSPRDRSPSANPTFSDTVHDPTPSDPYELFPGVQANEQQREAIDRLSDFLTSTTPGDDVFVLRGRGGTGKTTVIGKVIETLQRTDKGRAVAVSAYTHKATGVVKSQFKNRPRVKVGHHTVASLLGARIDENTGEFSYNNKAYQENPNIGRYSVIIVDEASMISDVILQAILNDREPGTKVVFMGDDVQLPPVGGKGQDSPSFEATDRADRNVALTERMRQGEESPIVGVTDVVAANVKAEKPALRAIPAEMRTDSFDAETNSGVIFVEDEGRALDLLVEDLLATQSDPEATKAIVFNNQDSARPQSVRNLNSRIRERLWGKDAPFYVPGDHVMFYGHVVNERGGLLLADDGEPIGVNADLAVVDEVDMATTESAFYWAHPKHDAIEYHATFKTIRLYLRRPDGTLIRDTDGKPFAFQALHPDDPEGLKKKNEVQEEIRRAASKDGRYWPAFYALNNYFPNLHHGYAITSHKSQGSTYRNAYVFEDNILGGSTKQRPKEKNQALYVALSRPSHKLVVQSTNNPNVGMGDYPSTYMIDPQDLVSYSDQGNYDDGYYDGLRADLEDIAKELKDQVDKTKNDDNLC